jgi:hypothetical protein
MFTCPVACSQFEISLQNEYLAPECQEYFYLTLQRAVTSAARIAKTPHVVQ